MISAGLHAEDRVCSILEKYGCTLERDESLDHELKIDFVITRFAKRATSFYCCGGQVTKRLDAWDKQEEFFRINSRPRAHGVSRALYIELTEHLDLEKGGALSVMAAILEFQFDRKYAGQKLTGVTIHEDLTYEFFDLPERIAALKKGPDRLADVRALADQGHLKAGVQQVNEGVRLLSGMIKSYNPSHRNGYIESLNGDRWFFRRTSVSDETLQRFFDQITSADDFKKAPRRTVEFDNGGFTKPGAKFKEAQNIRSAKERNPDSDTTWLPAA